MRHSQWVFVKQQEIKTSPFLQNQNQKSLASPSTMGTVFGNFVTLPTYVKNVEAPTQKLIVESQLLPDQHIQPPKQSLLRVPNSVITPVRTGPLEKWLQGYDGTKANFLVNGFKFGFSIPFQGPRIFRMSPNLQSAKENINILKAQIQIELDAGRVAGPFDEKPFENIQISPLGLVPKKTQGQFRIIHHLSYPDGGSINSGIPPDLCSVRYQNIDTAAAIIKLFGKGCHMAKTDIEQAYRIVPISPGDYDLLGFCIDGKYYYDKSLPMGLSLSCNIFETFSSALQWIAEVKLGVSGCAHILDDFLFIAPSYYKTMSDLSTFLKLTNELGVPIKSDKTVLPCTTISFVGIELDSIKMEKRLPQDKLQKIRYTLDLFRHKKKVTLTELQSLIGLLSYACSVVSPGRPFLRRIIDLTVGLRKPYHKRRLNQEARADLNAWHVFVEDFNGKSLLLSEQWESSEMLDLYTDASNVACGGYLGNEWFAQSWPVGWTSFHITIKELFPIVIAVELWAQKLKNRCIRFHSDNLSVVHIINKQSSKDKTIMVLLRRLVVQCLKHNIWFQAEHVPGLDNLFADHLSRLKIKEFLQVFPLQDPLERAIPQQMLAL